MSSIDCQATTLQGRPCKAYSVKDSKYCRVHQEFVEKEPVPDPKDLQIIALQDQVKSLSEKVSRNKANGLSFEDFFEMKDQKNIHTCYTCFLKPETLVFRLTGFTPDGLKAGWSFVDTNLSFPIDVYNPVNRSFVPSSINDMYYISFPSRLERLPITEIIINRLKIGKSPLLISFSGKKYSILILDLRISGIQSLISPWGDISVVDSRSKEYHAYLSGVLKWLFKKLGTDREEEYRKIKLGEIDGYKRGIYHFLRNLYTCFYLHHQHYSVRRNQQDDKYIVNPHILLEEVE